MESVFTDVKGLKCLLLKLCVFQHRQMDIRRVILVTVNVTYLLMPDKQEYFGNCWDVPVQNLKDLHRNGLNYITDCATLCTTAAVTHYHNWQWVFHMNFVPLFFYRVVNSATLKGFWSWSLCSRSYQSIWVRFKSRFFEATSLAIGVSWCINVLELQRTNWWLDILLQDFLVESRIHGSIMYSKTLKQQSSSRRSHYCHHVWLFFLWNAVFSTR